MPTITSSKLVLEMLENDGVYSRDPQVARIYEYINALNDELMWAVFYHPEQDDMDSGAAVSAFVLLFDREFGLTHAGKVATTRMRNEMSLLD